jgi:hypothetical protein
MKLSDTQRDVLTAAAQHPDHLAQPPDRLGDAVKEGTVSRFRQEIGQWQSVIGSSVGWAWACRNTTLAVRTDDHPKPGATGGIVPAGSASPTVRPDPTRTTHRISTTSADANLR